MGYTMPIVCKELNLPCPMDKSFTLEQYKEKFGIDLKPFIKLEEKQIYATFPNFTKVNLVCVGLDISLISKVGPITYSNQTEYDEGVEDATLTFEYVDSQGNAGYGIIFTIDKDTEFALENVKVAGVEA